MQIMGPTPNLLLNQKLWGGAQSFVFSQVLQAILRHTPVWKSLQLVPSVSIYLYKVYRVEIPRHLLITAFDFSLSSLTEHHAIPPRPSISTELRGRIERKPRNSSQNTNSALGPAPQPVQQKASARSSTFCQEADWGLGAPVLPARASSASQEPRVSSLSWWGTGCHGACKATAWGAVPCLAGPAACVSPSRRSAGPWDTERGAGPGERRHLDAAR